MQAQYEHFADASWLAAAGSVVAAAATGNAADIRMHNEGQLDPTPTPEHNPNPEFSGPGFVGVVNSSVNYVGLAAEQSVSGAKKRSRPFAIPR